MAIDKRIGIIGAGKMGATLISGLLRSGIIKKDCLSASDTSAQRCCYVSKTYGIKCFSINKTLVENSDLIIIAVEPKHVKTVLEDIGEELTNQLLVSIAAGISIEYIKRNLRWFDAPIIRAMPNTPCMVGDGVIVLTSSPEVSEEGLKIVEEIFSSVGMVLILDESYFDAVTGLSGSGPAYIYRVIEGLVEGGVTLGLARDVSLILAAQTVIGAGRIVLETKINPAKLRKLAATPEGTTIEGLKELERGDVKSLFGRAVVKAAQRSRELSKIIV